MIFQRWLSWSGRGRSCTGALTALRGGLPAPGKAAGIRVRGPGACGALGAEPPEGHPALRWNCNSLQETISQAAVLCLYNRSSYWQGAK